MAGPPRRVLTLQGSVAKAGSAIDDETAKAKQRREAEAMPPPPVPDRRKPIPRKKTAAKEAQVIVLDNVADAGEVAQPST
eukprot:431698-Amphidinium_carterae.1